MPSCAQCSSIDAVLRVAELDTLAVLEVGHLAPRSAPHLVALLGRNAQLGGPLLELDGVAAGTCRDIDELPRDAEIAVVVDADLGSDIDRVARRRSAGRRC